MKYKGKIHCFGGYDYEGEGFWQSFNDYHEMVAHEDYGERFNEIQVYQVNDSGNLEWIQCIDNFPAFSELIVDGDI